MSLGPGSCESCIVWCVVCSLSNMYGCGGIGIGTGGLVLRMGVCHLRY